MIEILCPRELSNSRDALRTFRASQSPRFRYNRYRTTLPLCVSLLRALNCLCTADPQTIRRPFFGCRHPLCCGCGRLSGRRSSAPYPVSYPTRSLRTFPHDLVGLRFPAFGPAGSFLRNRWRCHMLPQRTPRPLAASLYVRAQRRLHSIDKRRQFEVNHAPVVVQVFRVRNCMLMKAGGFSCPLAP